MGACMCTCNSAYYVIQLTKIGSLSVEVTMLGETSCATAIPIGLPSEASIVQKALSLGPNQRAASLVGE